MWGLEEIIIIIIIFMIIIIIIITVELRQTDMEIHFLVLGSGRSCTAMNGSRSRSSRTRKM